MNIFKRKAKPVSSVPVREIYKDKFGNHWFEFLDKKQIPARRAIAAEVATRFADMNLTKTRFKEIAAKMREYANQGDIVNLFALVQEIEFRLDFIGEEETLIELVSVYYLLEDEPSDQVSEIYKDRKKEILDNDEAARAFFLNASFQLITTFSNTSEVDILDYLNKNGQNARRLLRFFQASKSGGSLNQSITQTR